MAHTGEQREVPKRDGLNSSNSCWRLGRYSILRRWHVRVCWYTYSRERERDGERWMEWMRTKPSPDGNSDVDGLDWMELPRLDVM